MFIKGRNLELLNNIEGDVRSCQKIVRQKILALSAYNRHNFKFPSLQSFVDFYCNLAKIQNKHMLIVSEGCRER